MINDLLSVVVPCYNAGEWIDRCVASITAQSYDRLEVILVDDGSTDGTPALCDAWAARDGRVKVLHQTNSGSSAARENGLLASQGEFVTFADADDWVDTGMYEAMIGRMKSEKADIAVCGVADAFAITPPVRC